MANAILSSSYWLVLFAIYHYNFIVFFLINFIARRRSLPNFGYFFTH